MILRVDLCDSKPILSPRLTDWPHVQMEATNKLQTGTETKKILNTYRVGKCIYRIQGGKQCFVLIIESWNLYSSTKSPLNCSFPPTSSCLWMVYRHSILYKLPRGFSFNVTKFQVSRLEFPGVNAQFVDSFQGWKPWCVSLRISSCSFGSCPMSCSFRIHGEGQRK